MPKLVIEIQCESAPITTLIKQIQKGVEQFYYANLFALSTDYATTAIWRDWLKTGFHVAIVSAPPGIRGEDKIHTSLRAPSATPVVTAETQNGSALQGLEFVLEIVNQSRESLIGQSDLAKSKAMASGLVAERFFNPVVDAIASQGFSQSEIDQYMQMLRRGFLALTSDRIQSTSMALS